MNYVKAWGGRKVMKKRGNISLYTYLSLTKRYSNTLCYISTDTNML
jgi:hypothetical protein